MKKIYTSDAKSRDKIIEKLYGETYIPLLFVVISKMLHHIPRSIDDLLLLTDDFKEYTERTYDITIENGIV